MDRQLPQFLDSIEWNLVRRDALTAVLIDGEKRFVPIPPRNFGCDRHVLLVGVQTPVPAGSFWRYGGLVEQYSFQSPSSTSEFMPPVRLFSRSLKVNCLNLVIFPKIGPIPFLCQVTIPKWFKEALVEVWKYDGEDLTTFDRLNQLQLQLEQLGASQSGTPSTLDGGFSLNQGTTIDGGTT